MGIANSWAEVVTMGIVTLLGFSSGRSISIWLLVLSSSFVFQIGSVYVRTEF